MWTNLAVGSKLHHTRESRGKKKVSSHEAQRRTSHATLMRTRGGMFSLRIAFHGFQSNPTVQMQSVQMKACCAPTACTESFPPACKILLAWGQFLGIRSLFGLTIVLVKKCWKQRFSGSDIWWARAGDLLRTQNVVVIPGWRQYLCPAATVMQEASPPSVKWCHQSHFPHLPPSGHLWSFWDLRKARPQLTAALALQLWSRRPTPGSGWREKHKQRQQLEKWLHKQCH